MTSLKTANRRVGSLFAVAALVLATVTPGLVPAFASAAQLTERSVELSSSSKGATGVSYKATFTAVTAASAVVFDFCSDSPFLGEACGTPTGFNASSAAVADFTASSLTAARNNARVFTGDIDAGANTLELTGIANPTTSGPLYVRIATFASEADAQAYTATNIEDVVDSGSAAVSITDSVNVSAAVLESMTFCVSGNEITDNNCTRADAAALTAPTVKLGKPVGTMRALDSADVYEGNVYTQMSTNAASGAVVNIKTTTPCGGLLRAGSNECNIAAAGTSTDSISEGEPKIGVKVSAATNPSGAAQPLVTSAGDFQIAASSTYDTSIFKLNYVSGGASGITSPYGDPILDTNDAPVNNKNVTLTFGASAANNTPAGNYSTDFSLIATGKF